MENGWSDIKSAPKKGDVLLLLGETVPNSLDVRVGSWIHEDVAMEMGEDIDHRGGWIIYNTDSDWFIVPFMDAKAWAKIPAIT